jgi:DNA-binding XRE family transcriptional regulator
MGSRDRGAYRCPAPASPADAAAACLTLGISPSHLSLVESGKRWPSLAMMVHIAGGLDVEIEELLPPIE